MDDIEVSSIDVIRDMIDSSRLKNSDLKLSNGTYYNPESGFPTRYIFTSKPNVTYVAHEAGHAIDFLIRGKPERVLMSSFGFSYPQVELLGSYYDEPTTTQGIHAECRAFAYELHLLELLGFNINTHGYFFKNAKLICDDFPLADSYLIPRRTAKSKMANIEYKHTERLYQEGKRTFHDTSTTLKESVSTYNQERIEYAAKHMVKYYGRVTKEDVITLWHDVITLHSTVK